MQNLQNTWIIQAGYFANSMVYTLAVVTPASRSFSCNKFFPYKNE